jgi:hypothetical protein
MRLFTYVDAMIVDTPIVDEETRGAIRDDRRIEDRLRRCDIFRRYLDLAWVRLADSDAPLSWPEISREIEVDVEEIGYRTA